VIRPIDRERDAEGVVELIHEVFPAGTATVESWLQLEAAVPARAQHAAWVAIVDGAVAGRAEATLKWFSEADAAYAGVAVRRAFRNDGLGASLWERVEEHLGRLAASRVTTLFVETPEGVAFARARGFAEERAESLSCVDPSTVVSPPPDDSIRIVPLHETSSKEVYEVDMITTPDVPTTDEIADMPYDEWLEMFWRRPTVTLDGSFAAIVDGRVVGFTLLAANAERGRAFTEYTATLPVYRNRGIADRVKRASLAWAAAQGTRAAWTTNDETNAAMLAVNERLGYTSSLRRVEYLREREG
jgi:GNAT superfamily N-acetyltransferase